MDPSVETMQAQLLLWSLEIDRVAAKTQRAGGQAGFEATMCIDELKAFHAIAQAKLNAFQAAGDTRQAPMESEMKNAWNDLETAFKNLMPHQT